jgi:hypothetical protein
MNTGGRGSAVGTATGYRLEGLGSNPAGRIFRTRQDRPRVPPSLLCSGYRLAFPRVKRPGRGAYPRQSSAEADEKVELCPYSALRTFMACCRMSLNFTIIEWTQAVKKTASTFTRSTCTTSDNTGPYAFAQVWIDAWTNCSGLVTACDGCQGLAGPRGCSVFLLSWSGERTSSFVSKSGMLIQKHTEC